VNKQELRAEALEKRKALPSEYVQEQSLKITNQLFRLDIWMHEVYHTFLSIAHQKEVQTEPLITLLQGKDKTIVVPRMNENNELDHILLEESTVIAIQRFGVPEPLNGNTISDDQIDVVFVPLLCFDRNGNRLGYGKGYYDRFLSKTKANTLFIGLSLLDVLENDLEPATHDIPLHLAVTPETVYRFTP
jgi:5-formyltetrahydrofolate cyclo-ligase